ncbi:MAG: PKD domain-containing protein, partial [Bacteroidota bacterium]
MTRLILYPCLVLFTLLEIYGNPPVSEAPDALSTMMCEPDFEFTITDCSQTVSFQATAPIPINDPNLSFEWDFGDGSSAGNGAAVEHTYTALGSGTVSFTVVLMVTNTMEIG